jgi:hypothetical protein
MIGPDGSLENSWGDIPGKSTGTVIFAGPALCLAELYGETGEEKYRSASKRLLVFIRENFSVGGRNKEGVTNQAYKWCEALAIYGQVTGDKEMLDHAIWLGSEYLGQQIKTGKMVGAFYQGRSDEKIISVYVGKCIAPLVRLYEISGRDEFLRAAEKAADYLLEQQVEDGIFVNYYEPHGRVYDVICKIPRFDRLLFQRRLPTYKAWRPFISSWKRTEYPSFIARSGDTLRGVWLLSKHCSVLKPRVLEVVDKLLRYQQPHGGFPNSVGFSGDAKAKSWQDICSPTRWNGYVFLLLSYLVGAGVIGNAVTDAPIRYTVDELSSKFGEDGIFIETAREIRVYSGDSCVAEIEKPSGLSRYLADGWHGDLSGPRNSSACPDKGK